MTTPLLNFVTNTTTVLRANEQTLGLAGTSIGDVLNPPHTPWAAVMGDQKTRELRGAPLVFDLSLRLFIMVYCGIIQGYDEQHKEAMAQGELIETLLHTDETLGGSVLWAWVETIDVGYAQRNSSLIRTVRLTYVAGMSEMIGV